MKSKNLLMILTSLSLASLVFAQQPASKLRVASGVMAGNLIHRVDPSYPEEAKDAHIQGDVLLRATIDREGNVSELKAISGHPLFMQASLPAVKQWKYKPFLLNGEPVEVETVIRVQFRM